MVVCNTTALLMLGVWNMLWHFPTDYNPWKTCPNTLRYVLKSKEFTDGFPQRKHMHDHVNKYSCFNTTYMISEYKFPDCTFQSIPESVNHMKEHFKLPKSKQKSTIFGKPKQKMLESPKKIYFVGDSLMIQYFIALRCALESHQLLHIIEPVYVTDVFLRYDIVCDERCAVDPQFNNASRKTWCFGCKQNGEKADYVKDYLQHPLMWANRIPPDTIAILLGVGTWYNNHKKITNSNEVFRDTMVKTRAIVEKVKQSSADIRFFWLGLPTDTSFYNNEKYGWKSFAEKDDIAKEVLSPGGVQFVNISHLTTPRKNHDYQSCADGLHWCNPGEYSNPYFINRIVLHLLANTFT